MFLTLLQSSGAGSALAANSVQAGAAELGQPSLTQAHQLAANGITAGAALLGAPTLGAAPVNVPLDAAGLSGLAPVLGAPALVADHVLTAAGITTPTPSLPAPSFQQLHDLTGEPIVGASPTLGVPVARIGLTAQDVWDYELEPGQPAREVLLDAYLRARALYEKFIGPAPP